MLKNLSILDPCVVHGPVYPDRPHNKELDLIHEQTKIKNISCWTTKSTKIISYDGPGYISPLGKESTTTCSGGCVQGTSTPLTFKHFYPQNILRFFKIVRADIIYTDFLLGIYELQKIFHYIDIIFSITSCTIWVCSASTA